MTECRGDGSCEKDGVFFSKSSEILRCSLLLAIQKLEFELIFKVTVLRCFFGDVHNLELGNFQKSPEGPW